MHLATGEAVRVPCTTPIEPGMSIATRRPERHDSRRDRHRRRGTGRHAAAITLVEAGRRPIAIDEAPRSGGQIYRRPPQAIGRDAQTLYGFEAGRATRLHRAFDALGDRVDYRPGTLIWNATDERLHLDCGWACRQPALEAGRSGSGRHGPGHSAAGLDPPGAYTLGGAQVALKAQALQSEARVVFFGTGPLLYLVAYQYAKAGIDVRAVLDTTPEPPRSRHCRDCSRRSNVSQGTALRVPVEARGARIAHGVRPLAITAGADEAVSGSASRGPAEARNPLRAMPPHSAMASNRKPSRRSSRPQLQLQSSAAAVAAGPGRGRPQLGPEIYLAGDGALVRGADVAEPAGERAALTLLADDGESAHQSRIHTLSARITRRTVSTRARRSRLPVPPPWRRTCPTRS